MKKRWKSKIIFVLSLLSLQLTAQKDSIWQQKPHLKISGFADVFYVYDFNKPQGTERQPFLFNHNRHNEFNLNLGIVKLEVDHKKYRANFALQAGTYANDNYAAEPGLLKNIFEANIGIALNNPNSLWLQAGVLPSHIGFESAISMDNMTLTRSLLAENSPYFLTGAKLTFNPNNKWEIAALIVNGWQRIQRLQGNSMPSFGSQFTYTPSSKTSFNWSTFIGTDDPDAARRIRYFNNLYGKFQWTDKFTIITGIDFGAQQKVKNSTNYDLWFSPVIIGQLIINNTWKTAFRIEHYNDKTGVIIPSKNPNGFQTSGLSLNLDYSPSENILCRIEGRWLKSKDQIFEKQSDSTNNNQIIAASIAIRFFESANPK
jgi:hypothetical protein